MEKIREFFDGYTNIYFMSEMLTKIEVNSLLRDVDVFVSLHRAEGFGLGMAEAMLNGHSLYRDKLVCEYRVYG